MKKSESKLTLDSREWREFKFNDVFTKIQRGKRLRKADHHIGNIPYISSTAQNNGVDDFIGNEDGVRMFSDCITIANSGSVGSAFYHNYEFVASDHVTQLKRKGLDRYAYLFLATMAARLSEKYSFNREINDERIKRERIFLPINGNGEIDFEFMASYMKQTEQEILKPTIERLCKQLIISNIGGGKSLHSNWKTFTIGDLFNLKRPIGRKEDDYPNGKIPFVASGGVNNGVTKFCLQKSKESLDKGNCLTVSPVDGSCYYQATDFLGRGGAGSSIIILYAKEFDLNKFNALFISQAITKTASAKYCYGRMASLDRIKRDKIILPADSEGKPDFAFMTQFMQEVERDILGTTLKYLRERQSVNECKTGGGKLEKLCAGRTI